MVLRSLKNLKSDGFQTSFIISILLTILLSVTKTKAILNVTEVFFEDLCNHYTNENGDFQSQPMEAITLIGVSSSGAQVPTRG